MIMRSICSAIIPITISFMGCKHKPEFVMDQLPPETCDTISITYLKDIKPIFAANCYSCHGSAVVVDGSLDLEDTVPLKNYLSHGFHGDGIYGSELYHIIAKTPLTLSMPPSYTLDSCSLAKIHYWLKLGAPLQ